MSVRWDRVDKSRFWGERPQSAPVPATASTTEQRWDAVVDKSQFTEPVATAPAIAAQAQPGVMVPVKIWLYGELAALLPERPLVIDLPDGFTLGAVVAELGKRCGEDFLKAVILPDGKKSSHCRVFVDGLPVDEVDTPVHVGPSPALVELIMISATEGG